MMLTSLGKCFSNASISGALHDVCPPTMAPTLVAMRQCQYTDTPAIAGIIQGPKVFTTASIFFASTLYIIRSLQRETKWPFCIISTSGWRKLSTCHCSNTVCMGAILQSPETPSPKHHISLEDRRHELYEHCVSTCLGDGGTYEAMVSNAQLNVS
jgi:hypothetical protein